MRLSIAHEPFLRTLTTFLVEDRPDCLTVEHVADIPSLSVSLSLPSTKAVHGAKDQLLLNIHLKGGIKRLVWTRESELHITLYRTTFSTAEDKRQRETESKREGSKSFPLPRPYPHTPLPCSVLLSSFFLT
jgi:hypothetical protein